MLYVACESADENTINPVTVHSVHGGEKAAMKAASKLAKQTGRIPFHALPVSMARAGSVKPKAGDVLVTYEEESGAVAVANTENDQ